tara:strand:- start:4670 stop:9616 length:4947 start_codon:yes stop_codon:yes gene_type:complete
MTTSPLRTELTTYRNSKNADLKLDGGFFYRRAVPSKSANLHGTYTDLYDNADDIHVITGGMSPRYSQFDTTLPERPSFGSGALSGLYFQAKVQNTDYANPSGTNDTGMVGAGDSIGIKAFKIESKISTEGGASDGTSMINNEDILAFSTYFTPEPPSEVYADIFDGVGEEKVTKVEQGQLVVQKDAYISASIARKYGQVYGKEEDRLLGWPMKYSDYKDHFGEKFDGQDIVRINRRRTKGRYVPGKFMSIGFKQGSFRYVSNESKTGITGKQKHDTYDSKKIAKHIKYIDRQIIPTGASPYTVSRSDVVTTTNTTLHSVKEAKTFNELSSSGGTKEVAWGKIAFSSENVHEGGQSIKMHTFWPALSNQDGWRRTSIYYPADSQNNHTHQRQECYIVKQIPVPKRWQDQENPATATKIGSVVSTKINIKKLAGAESKNYRRENSTVTNAFISSDDDGNGCTQPTLSRIFTRGIAICFSEFPPGMDNDGKTKRDDDTFYTFMEEHHPNMEHGTAANRDDGAKDFYGVFLANEMGNLTINALGSASAPNYLSFVADPYTHKVGTNITPADTISKDDFDLTDRWLDFNFVIDPDTQGVVLMVCDADDGKCISRIQINNSARNIAVTDPTGLANSNGPGDFPEYMSIWNVNTGNPNSGVGAYDDNHGPFADLSESQRFTWKKYSDTGLTFESCKFDDQNDDGSGGDSPPAIGIGQHEYINPGDSNMTTTPTELILSDRRNGDTGGHLEKYWALVAGSEFYVITDATASASQTNPIYGRLTSSKQYVSESKYAKVTFENKGVRVVNGDAIVVKAQRPIDGGIAPGTDAENVVYIDSIKCHNFSPEIENATVSNANPSAGHIRIPATHKTFATTYADLDAYNGTKDEGPYTTDTWSYISLGFASEDDFEGARKHFLLNGFNTKNPRLNDPILTSYDSDLSYIRAGYTGDASTADLGEHTGIAMFHNNGGDPATGSASTGRGLTVGNNSGSGDGMAAQYREFEIRPEVIQVGSGGHGAGTFSPESNNVQAFSRKGFFALNFTERTDEGATSRENAYCSARVTELIDIKNGKIEVDNEDIFKLDPNEEYIMYRDGEGYANTAYLDGLKVVEKEDGVITLNKSLATAKNSSGAGATFARQSRLGSLYIGPKRFWLVIAILNKSAADDDSYLPERSYSSIVGTTGIETKGATYNEYLYTDKTYYQYKRNMDPFANLESNEVRLDVDFGFGSISDEVSQDVGHAGMLNLDALIDGSSLSAPNVDAIRMDVSGIIEALKPELGQTLPLLITPLSHDNQTLLKIFAEEASNEYDKPFLLAEFEDELPEIDDFKVEPNMENPFFPTYSWSCGAEDAWYGFLNIDSKSITNQYHNAVIHLPMNEEGRHAKTLTSLPVEKIQGTTQTVSGVMHNVEGLGGFCLEFDGNDDYVEINNSAPNDPTAECTKEMTVLIHAIPDNASDSRVIVSQYSRNNKEKFRLLLNSSNQVEARVNWAAGANYVELTSSSIVTTDGETPTVIMLVVDTELDSANVKLYINGNLEDISGQATTAGSTNNWKIGQSIHGGSSEIYVGNSHSSGTNGFDGKLEELVIYKKALYPFSGKETELTVTKPFVEIDDSGSTASLPITSKIFIKDYHNIRGKTAEQVATAPQVTYRKAAFRLDNS